MIRLMVSRLFWLVPTLLVISVVTFVIIQLPPGDYVTTRIMSMQAQGEVIDEGEIQALRELYGLDKPYVVRYFGWLGGLMVGDLGMSMEHNRAVTELIGERLGLTVGLSLSALIFTWALAIPIGIYSAVRKYSVGDHVVTFLGFIGLATPNFLLALLFMYVSSAFFGIPAGGLLSPQYQDMPWSVGKAFDLFLHLLAPVVIIGTAGTAGLIRVMRGNLLDELNKQYVITARAKGLSPVKVLLKYPVRIAINPLVSTIGWVLPAIISGEAITSIVLGLPTTGELLFSALMNQDMYLAGSLLMVLSLLTVIGTLISDLLLILLDPRIRYETREA